MPAHFRFAVKAPKTITHEARLADVDALLDRFVDEIEPLGNKLGVILVQLPPGLAFDRGLATAFFKRLRSRSAARISCEPRHRSWFEPDVENLLADLQIARVAADPAILPAAARPGGWRGFAYWRLHGSPVIYRSSYDARALDDYARAIEAEGGDEAWCIFDNTASSAATANALTMTAGLTAYARPSSAAR